MKKSSLLEQLTQFKLIAEAEWDNEELSKTNHLTVIDLLLDYINDEEVRSVVDGIMM